MKFVSNPQTPRLFGRPRLVICNLANVLEQLTLFELWGGEGQINDLIMKAKKSKEGGLEEVGKHVCTKGALSPKILKCNEAGNL